MSEPSTTPLATNLPRPKRFITTHNQSGQAIVHTNASTLASSNSDDANLFHWHPYDDSNMAFSVVYTTSAQPADLNENKDLKTHEGLMEKSGGKIGLVNPGGSVLRCVDFAPGYKCAMHRTQSLDYGIVMEGEIDMVLDSGEVHHMNRGDVAVQRATQHQWVNRSQTEWARMMFVLQDIKPLTVGGKEMKEDLGTAGDLPASGN